MKIDVIKLKGDPSIGLPEKYYTTRIYIGSLMITDKTRIIDPEKDGISNSEIERRIKDKLKIAVDNAVFNFTTRDF